MAKTAFRFRDAAGFAARQFTVWLSANESSIANSPTVTAGSGAPTSSPPNGSIYLRTDGSNGDDSLFMMIGSSWVAIKGQTA